MSYLYLAIAIVGEVCATSALKSAGELTRAAPIFVVVVGYAVALIFLSMSLKSLPVAIAYAMWAGIGTFLIALAGSIAYGQSLDPPAILGMSFIVVGVVIINGWSGVAGP